MSSPLGSIFNLVVDPGFSDQRKWRYLLRRNLASTSLLQLSGFAINRSSRDSQKRDQGRNGPGTQGRTHTISKMIDLERGKTKVTSYLIESESQLRQVGSIYASSHCLLISVSPQRDPYFLPSLLSLLSSNEQMSNPVVAEMKESQIQPFPRQNGEGVWQASVKAILHSTTGLDRTQMSGESCKIWWRQWWLKGGKNFEVQGKRWHVAN